MDRSAVPRLAPGCRLHPTQELLVVPEGALKLSGPARDVLLLVDSSRDVSALVEELSRQYPEGGKGEIEGDVLDLLRRMKDRGFIRI